MAKVTFDGDAKLIIVNDTITDLDVKVDIYSEWKNWVLTGDNSKYLAAFSVIGGDQITSTRFLGSTFFLENGWKIRPYEGDHTLTITGNLYTRTEESPVIHTLGNYNVIVDLTTSNLIDTITTTGVDAPTASEIAIEVWDTIASTHLTTGTFGQLINLIKATTDLNFTQLTQANAKLDIANDLVTTLLKFSSNRTKIDNSAMTMTVYDDDGLTPIKIFDLKNFAGSPSITEVAERAPQ